MFAIEPGAAGAALHSLAMELDRPRDVLVISPHWETQQPTVGTTEAVADHRLETVHDFGGFDPRLYENQ
jgi:4,5-DOPA dioxygenase extradiol